MIKLGLAAAAVGWFVYPFVMEAVALFNHAGAVLSGIAS